MSRRGLPAGRFDRWTLVGAGLALAAALVLGGYDRFGPRRTPIGQPPLARITAANFPELREAFNAASDRTRLVVLLSPT